MKTSETIFRLIEQGDMLSILADKALLRRFHQLMDNDLLTMVNDKVVISKKGEQLRNSGRKWYPDLLVEEDLPKLWVSGKEQLRLLRGSSLLVMITWLLVLLYIFYYCLLLCP